MTAAFASIANGGVYNNPYYYTKVLDHNGNTLLEQETVSRQVMKTSTAYLLTSAMQDTVIAGLGSTTQPAFVNYDMPVAGKTGTTTNTVDRWFCGYTPYYTCSIWTGFDNNFEVINSQQNLIWRNIMETIHKEKKLAYKEFPMPDSILTATVCTKSGLLAKMGVCDAYEGGSTVRTEYFAKGTVPTEYCDCHVIATICLDTGHLATEYCTNVEEQVLLVKYEPVVYRPTELDLTTASPTPVPEGYIPTEEETKKENIKTLYEYTTSDTKYILPSEYCTIHTFVETNPQDSYYTNNTVYPYVPYFPTPTPTMAPEETTNPFSNGGFQSH